MLEVRRPLLASIAVAAADARAGDVRGDGPRRRRRILWSPVACPSCSEGCGGFYWWVPWRGSPPWGGGSEGDYGNAILNAAAAAGVQYGARRGWYHVYILPLICLELRSRRPRVSRCLGCLGIGLRRLRRVRGATGPAAAAADEARGRRGPSQHWPRFIGRAEFVATTSRPATRSWRGIPFSTGDVCWKCAGGVSFRGRGVVGLPARAAFVFRGGAARPLPVRRGCGVCVPFAAGCVSNMKAARENPAGVVRQPRPRRRPRRASRQRVESPSLVRRRLLRRIVRVDQVTSSSLCRRETRNICLYARTTRLFKSLSMAARG